MSCSHPSAPSYVYFFFFKYEKKQVAAIFGTYKTQQERLNGASRLLASRRHVSADTTSCHRSAMAVTFDIQRRCARSSVSEVSSENPCAIFNHRFIEGCTRTRIHTCTLYSTSANSDTYTHANTGRRTERTDKQRDI